LKGITKCITIGTTLVVDMLINYCYENKLVSI